jgi:hypothetical protein
LTALDILVVSPVGKCKPVHRCKRHSFGRKSGYPQESIREEGKMKRLPLIAVLFVLTGGLQAFGQNPIYDSETGDSGNQGWLGNLSEIFTVNSPITVSELGVFDNGSSTLNEPLTVGIANFTNSGVVPVVSYTFAAGTYSNVQGNDVFYLLPTPVVLTPGTYEVDSVGWGPSQLNGNTNCNGLPVGAYGCTGSPSSGTSLDSLGGAITFNGGAYDDTSGGLDYPAGITQLPANSLSVGTFAVPEGGASPLYLLLAGAACFGAVSFAFRCRLASRES